MNPAGHRPGARRRHLIAAALTLAALLTAVPAAAATATVMAFTFAAGKITEIYILADRSRPTRPGPGAAG